MSEPSAADITRARRVVEVADCSTAGHLPSQIISADDRPTHAYCRCGNVVWTPRRTDK